MKIGGYILMVLMVYSCAQVMPLDGGPKDIQPPRIDSATTIPYNGITNFRGKTIQIGFDEYLKLNDPKEKILITPIPDTMPEYRVKNKLFFIEFPRALNENTTYSIFIDGALSDITENNDSLYQFVFSTGNHIDSLKINGTVKNAFSNTPAKEVMVGLYSDIDSAVFNEKPIYIARTDEQGRYEMSYIKPGKYRLFALNDANKNYKADQIEEPIAFLNNAIEIQKDTSYNLELFKREDLRQFTKINEYKHPGQLTIVLNQEEEIKKVSSEELSGWSIETTDRKDSTLIWLPENTVTAVSMVIETESFSDTITVDRYVKKGTAKKQAVKLSAFKKGVVSPGDTMVILTSFPVDSVDEALISVWEDTLEIDFELLVVGRQIKVLTETKVDQKYKVILDSAAIKDIYGQSNDSTALAFEQKGKDFFGKLIISFDSLFVEKGFVEVLAGKDIVRMKTLSNSMEFLEMPPGNYELRLIEDLNGNGKWDTGDYGKGRQPEKVIYHNQKVDIKSNWDMEINWKYQPETPEKTNNKPPPKPGIMPPGIDK